MAVKNLCCGPSIDNALCGLGTVIVGVKIVELMALRSCAIRYLSEFGFLTGSMGVFQGEALGTITPEVRRPEMVSAIPASASGL